MMIFFMTLALSWPSFIGVSASLSKDVSIASSLLRGKQQDPFVQLAPLVVAMACRDGVALVAAHPWSEDDDFLLFGETDEDASNSLEGVSRNPNSNTANSALTGLPFLDLPTTYAGPLRIQSVGSQGTALVACGWRADGSGRLLEKARSLCDKELGAFGDEFIRFLPIQLSLYMADCAVSERVSCCLFRGDQVLFGRRMKAQPFSNLHLSMVTVDAFFELCCDDGL